MSGPKIKRQKAALERLTSQIAESLSCGKGPTFSQRQEYNKLKDVLSKQGITHPGRLF